MVSRTPATVPSHQVLDLSFRRTGDDGAYEVTAAADDTVHTATVRLGSGDLGERTVRLSRSMRHRGDDTDGAQAVADLTDLGGRLFEWLFAGEIGQAYRMCRQAAEDRGVPFRITLSLGDVPELLELPWEVLYDDPLFIAVQRDTALVRRIGADAPLHPVLVRGMVRVLGVIASPQGPAALDVDVERRHIDDQLRHLTGGGVAEIEWIERATIPTLQEALRGDHHVLHYIGHSDVTPAGDGVLLLEGDDGRAQTLSASALANMVGRRTALRLVVLNSCKGARTSSTDPAAGIATKLVKLGIPAVVGMQFDISDQAAITFGSTLYRSLIELDRPIDEAVADARLAILTSGNTLEWATPVLFQHGDAADLFDLALVGWYTLDGNRPARFPELHRPGFLGLALDDSIDRAITLLGQDFNPYEGLRPGSISRRWRFQDQSHVSIEADAAGSITEMTVAIDGDDPGGLRVALPYDLVLGVSKMADTRRVGTTPSERRMSPELILMVDWDYQDPNSAEGVIHIEFGFSTAVGRQPEPPAWFHGDMDVADRLITSCRIKYG